MLTMSAVASLDSKGWGQTRRYGDFCPPAGPIRGGAPVGVWGEAPRGWKNKQRVSHILLLIWTEIQKNTSVIICTYTTHSVSYWRAKWPSVHYKLHKHQQLPTKLVQVQYMSLIQSRCRLDLVQHHLPIRLGCETSYKFSVIKLQENVFLHWCQQQSFKSLLIHCGAQLRLHQRQLRKAAVGRSNETGFVASGAGRIWKCGYPSGASAGSRRKFFFVMVSTVWPVCCLQFTVPYGVGATVCGCALRGSDKSLTLTTCTVDTAVRLWAPTHISSLLHLPTLPPNFLKTRRICINLKTGPGAGWGAVSPICPLWRR